MTTSLTNEVKTVSGRVSAAATALRRAAEGIAAPAHAREAIANDCKGPLQTLQGVNDVSP